jgi:hypothetical protein
MINEPSTNKKIFPLNDQRTINKQEDIPAK